MVRRDCSSPALPRASPGVGRRDPARCMISFHVVPLNPSLRGGGAVPRLRFPPTRADADPGYGTVRYVCTQHGAPRGPEHGVPFTRAPRTALYRYKKSEESRCKRSESEITKKNGNEFTGIGELRGSGFGLPGSGRWRCPVVQVSSRFSPGEPDGEHPGRPPSAGPEQSWSSTVGGRRARNLLV